MEHVEGIEVVQNGRRKATIRERAGKFAVKFFISDDEADDDEEVGGVLAMSKVSATSRATAWTQFGVLP